MFFRQRVTAIGLDMYTSRMYYMLCQYEYISDLLKLGSISSLEVKHTVVDPTGVFFGSHDPCRYSSVGSRSLPPPQGVGIQERSPSCQHAEHIFPGYRA